MHEARFSSARYWRRGGLVACGFAALGPGSAGADPIAQTEALPVAPADFSSSLTFSGFDPALGTLTGVNVDLTGNLVGRVSYESREAAPSTFSAGLSGIVSLNRPDDSQIIAVAPSAAISTGLAAFDGTTDFAGASGGSAALLRDCLGNDRRHAGRVGPGPVHRPGNDHPPRHRAGQRQRERTRQSRGKVPGPGRRLGGADL